MRYAVRVFYVNEDEGYTGSFIKSRHDYRVDAEAAADDLAQDYDGVEIEEEG